MKTKYSVLVKKIEDLQEENKVLLGRFNRAIDDLVAEAEEAYDLVDWCENEVRFYENDFKQNCANCDDIDRCNIAKLLTLHNHPLEIIVCGHWTKDFRAEDGS